MKILLEYLFELSSKSKTSCKWCNDEDIVADGGPGASSMTCKHSAKRGERGNSKTYRFEGVTLLTAFASHLRIWMSNSCQQTCVFKFKIVFLRAKENVPPAFKQ